MGATLAIASPVHHNLHKKAIVWDVVTDVVYVTVTEGHLPSSHPETTLTVQHTHFVNPVAAPTPKKVVPTTTSTPPPPPPPSSTSTPPPPPPAPTTSVAPAPVVQEPAPVVVTKQQAAPAVFAAIPTPAPAPVVEEAPAPAVVESTPKGSSLGGLPGAVVDYHNKVRQLHGSPKLSWSDSLASSARQLAESCTFAHDMGINGGGYGQNIYMQGLSNDISGWDKSQLLGNAIVNSWYTPEEAMFHEKNYYGQANPPVIVKGADMAHFTQVVWKDTTTVGCAANYCGQQGKFFQWSVVCNYGPSGNFANEFAKNVREPSSSSAPKVAAMY